jgi:hypothetical protein
MTGYNLEYGVLPDGSFSIELLDVEEANEDHDDYWGNRDEVFGYDLLEQLFTDDHYSFQTPLDIMMQSISDEARKNMMFLIGSGYKAITIEMDAFEDKKDTDGIKLNLISIPN